MDFSNFEERMKLAILQDRDRFFAVADTLHLQPKYAEHLEELEVVKQQWRDITDLENYPHIDFPLALPDWFPDILFMSNFPSNHMEIVMAEMEMM
ncbi:MAG: hypothetical protein R3Y53_08035 [Bacillota bacterium]